MVAERNCKELWQKPPDVKVRADRIVSPIIPPSPAHKIRNKNNWINLFIKFMCGARGGNRKIQSTKVKYELSFIVTLYHGIKIEIYTNSSFCGEFAITGR